MAENRRYVARLRNTQGYRDDDPIDLDELMSGDIGTWDTECKCFVKKDKRGQWVPE